ncbi:MAG: ABC transporter permease, partial [Acidobacteria bacterium]|nr:ABC transporter permease [Acidobacteriota bacterium]
ARTSQSAATAIFLMVIATLWFGCSNAAREIVAEQAVFHRERMVNLKVSSYLIAKLAMLGLLGLVQCSALLLVVGQGCALVGDRWRTLFLLWLAALVGTGLGLGLSAIARTSEVAISLVPLVLLPMVVLGGAMQPVHGLKQPARSLAQAMASRWAFEGLIALEGAARPGVLSPVGPTLEAGTSPRATGGLARAVVKKVDLAEHYFPLTERNPPSAGARALATMFFGLVTAIAWILRLRGRSR